jgi:hypothetical protein
MRQDPALIQPRVSPHWGRLFSEPPTPVPVWSANWHLGNQYTCPAGKKAIVGFVCMYNPQATTTTFNGYIGSAVAGNQFAVNIGIAATSSFTWYQGIGLNAGDIYNITASAAINGYARVWEFPAAEPLVFTKTQSINGIVNTYTAPAGKCAATLYSIYDAFGFGCNTSGAAILMWTTFTPSGGATQRSSSVQSLAAGGSFYYPFSFHMPHLGPGDSLAFAAQATGINVWNVFAELEL